jgi:hypothetical protein
LHIGFGDHLITLFEPPGILASRPPGLSEGGSKNVTLLAAPRDRAAFPAEPDRVSTRSRWFASRLMFHRLIGTAREFVIEVARGVCSPCCEKKS